MDERQLKALERVLAMYWEDEARHFDESDSPPDHIYIDLLILKAWWTVQTDTTHQKGKPS